MSNKKNEVTPDTPLAASCLGRIQEILTQARYRALQSVNAAMLAAYWHVGREIVEEEQRGQDRAGYGERLIEELSEHLTRGFGKGFSESNLQKIRRFYVTYRDRVPGIPYSMSTEFVPSLPTAPVGLTDIAAVAPPQGFQPELSWTHYRVLMRVAHPEARSFYEIECAKARWSVRQLERQITSFL